MVGVGVALADAVAVGDALAVSEGDAVAVGEAVALGVAEGVEVTVPNAGDPASTHAEYHIDAVIRAA